MMAVVDDRFRSVKFHLLVTIFPSHPPRTVVLSFSPGVDLHTFLRPLRVSPALIRRCRLRLSLILIFVAWPAQKLSTYFKHLLIKLNTMSCTAIAFSSAAVRPVATLKVNAAPKAAKAVFVSNATVKKTTAMQV